MDADVIGIKGGRKTRKMDNMSYQIGKQWNSYKRQPGTLCSSLVRMCMPALIMTPLRISGQETSSSAEMVGIH